MSDQGEVLHRSLLMFISLQKVNNEAYTHFLGKFRHNEKMAFNSMIKASELFCKTVSDKFPEETIEAADKLEGYFSDMIFKMIKEGEFTLDDNHLLKNKLNEMLEEPEVLEYDSYSIKHVLKLLDKTTK